MGAIDELVQRAADEARQRGHATITAAHMVLALKEIDGVLFARYFGNRDLREIETRLAAVPAGDGPPEPDITVTMLVKMRPASEEDLEPLAQELSLIIRPKDMFESAADQVPPSPRVLLAQDLADVSRQARIVAPVHPMVRRDQEAMEALALALSMEPQAPLVIGADGIGKSTLAESLAARLVDPAYTGPMAGAPVVITSAEGILGYGGGDQLGKVIDACAGSAVLFIDDLEVLAALGTTNIDFSILTMIRSTLHDPRLRVILSMSDGYIDRLQTANRELYEELVPVVLSPLSQADVTRIVDDAAVKLGEHHGVVIDAEAKAGVLQPPTETDVLVHPGLALERLDRISAAASLRGAREVVIDGPGIVGRARRLDPAESAARLKAKVRGQDHAIDAMLRRLTVTMAGLDDRPERPNGVFLLSGPTGTGKTELARQLATELYGSEEHLIRLDMSEYPDRWSVTRLLGPGPGYLGSNEPEGWLTTRIRRNPHSVLLLDEIEKADPSIWNVFLQVFDAGRLTDGSGRVAEFGDVTIVMTSNIGAEHFADRRSTGFGDSSRSVEDDVEKVGAELKLRMRPELLNRLDEIVVFVPLDEATVRLITVQRLDGALARLASRGWVVTASPDAVSWLAERGYEREYGARPLLRLIDAEVVARAAAMEPGHYRLVVTDAGLALEAA